MPWEAPFICLGAGEIFAATIFCPQVAVVPASSIGQPELVRIILAPRSPVDHYISSISWQASDFANRV
jgi:hypothetical protein